MLTTDDRLHDGRVVYAQPVSGFRSGIEPVLLAASVTAKPGEQVLEAGTGAGAALLCLHARVPAIRSMGVEADEAMADLATANAAANGFAEMRVVAGRIETVALSQNFNHAIANPPYHATSGSISPEPGRDMAKRGSEPLLRTWVSRLAESLRDRGSLTFILPSALIPDGLQAMAQSQCPCTILFPLWPMAGRAAKLVMLRGIKHGRTPMRLASGLILHEAGGGFTQAAHAVLRDGAALVLG